MRNAAILLALSLALQTWRADACELALVLAVDVSGSVDTAEYKIQMEGLGAALADGAVSEALVVSKAKVMVMQWSGTGRQHISIPWTHMIDFDVVDQMALEVASLPRVWRNFSTAIGEAVETALVALGEVPECQRHVIDVSGDGLSNEGVMPKQARLLALEKGVTINGLAIEATEKGLTTYFREHLIVGPGAFAVQAETFHDYPRRIRQKLLREITKQVSELR